MDESRQGREREDSGAPRESREPREAARHTQSNNWRVRAPTTVSDANDRPKTIGNGNNPTNGWGRRQEDTTSNNRWDRRDDNFGVSSSDRQPSGNTWRSREAQPNFMFKRDGHQTPRISTPSSSLVEGSDALSEGRRVYMGNILYHVRPEEITEVLNENGFKDIEQINISTDPITGRNPGYCFVEFESCESANAAIERMAGVTIQNRPLKMGPCKPKGRLRQQQHEPLFQRWSNWNGDQNGVQVSEQGPLGAEENLVDVVPNDQRYRVYVGGLDKMTSQEQNDRELRAVFEGFNVVAVSKRITPSEATRSKPGKHHYAFVDLETEKEAMLAIKALDGLLWNGERLKVKVPKILPAKLAERGTRYHYQEKSSRSH